MPFGLDLEYLTIKDSSGKLLASGKIKGRKTVSGASKYSVKFDHVSVDGRYFFNRKSKNFQFVFSANVVEDKPFDGSLPYQDWRMNWVYPNEDIYKDNTSDELDEEVKLLVKCLNDIDGIETTCSCCGHGKYNLYVDFDVNKVEPIMKLEFLIFQEFHDDFELLYDAERVACTDKAVLTLRSKKKGKKAYEAAKAFALKLYDLDA